MTDAGRFELVSWGTGGAAYDRLSGATHLLDEIAVLLLENRFLSPDEITALACSRYDAEPPERIRTHVANGLKVLKEAGLLT